MEPTKNRFPYHKAYRQNSQKPGVNYFELQKKIWEIYEEIPNKDYTEKTLLGTQSNVLNNVIKLFQKSNLSASKIRDYYDYITRINDYYDQFTNEEYQNTDRICLEFLPLLKAKAQYDAQRDPKTRTLSAFINANIKQICAEPQKALEKLKLFKKHFMIILANLKK